MVQGGGYREDRTSGREGALVLPEAAWFGSVTEGGSAHATER